MIGLGLGLDRGGFVSSPSLLLDTYPATAAYSLRKLRNSYSGSAIRVRRQSDNTEQDIGFVGKDLDTAALTSFVGANNAFTATWYNQQSGNNLTQSTAASQPTLVTTGTIVEVNGKPAVRFADVNDRLIMPRLYSANTWAIFAVVRIPVLTGFRVIMSQHTGSAATGRTIFMQFNDAQYEVFFNNGTSYTGTHSTAMTTNQSLLGSFAAGNNYSLSLNGALEEVITGQSLTPLDTNLTVGGTASSLPLDGGEIQELIFYNTDQSANRTGIESNINDYYNIYP